MNDNLLGTLLVVAILGSALALLIMFPPLILVLIVLFGLGAIGK